MSSKLRPEDVADWHVASCVSASLGVALRWNRLAGPHVFEVLVQAPRRSLLAALDVGRDPGTRVSAVIAQTGNDQVPWLVHFYRERALVRHDHLVDWLRRGDANAPVEVGIGFFLLDYDPRVPLLLGVRELPVRLQEGDRLPVHLRSTRDYMVAHRSMLETPSSGVLRFPDAPPSAQ